MKSLFSLIPSGERAVELPVLEAAVSDGDVLIDCLTDEELFWLRNGEASDDPAMDEPYLSSLDDRSRRVATDSGLRSLIAKGMVDVDPDDPAQLEFAGAYAILGELRRTVSMVTRLRLDVPGDESVRYAFGLVSDGLVLTEEVADGGFHDFVLQSPSGAASALASIFDRHGTAGPGGESAAIALAGSADRGNGDALHTVLVRVTGTDAAGRRVERSLTVRGDRSGVTVADSSDGSEVDRRRFGLDRLEELALDLILGDVADR